MRSLLKTLDLDDNATNIYLGCLGKLPLTFIEIKLQFPNKSEEKISAGLKQLLEKELLYKIEAKFESLVERFFFAPPFPAIIQVIQTFKQDIDQDSSTELERKVNKIKETFDGELISFGQKYNDVLNGFNFDDSSGEMLNEIEQNFKKLFHVLFKNNIDIVSKLSEKPNVKPYDISLTIQILSEKLNESESIIAQMFSQFGDILNDIYGQTISKQRESFNSLIYEVNDSIKKAKTDLSTQEKPEPLINFEPFEKSIKNVIKDFSSKYKPELTNIWLFDSREAIKEEIRQLLKSSKTRLTIVVPEIDTFIPLDELKLDYSLDLTELGNKKSSHKKPKPPQIVVRKGKKQKPNKKIDEAFEATAKKVSELKGYELSHEIANLIAMISELIPESISLKKMKEWLDRLLTIRKHLDNNLQYLLLEDINGWKTNYLKVEEEENDKKIEEMTSEKEPVESEILHQEKRLQIKIISSENHKDLHVLALNKKTDIEYKRIKHNNIVLIQSDDSYLLLGYYQIIKKRPYYTLNGFGTNLRPLIACLSPVLTSLDRKSNPRKEIKINNGFNEILQNINLYTGLKMGELLESMLDIAFKKTGISLNVLELKLLVSKLKGISTSLDNDFKTEVIENIYTLNSQLTTLPLKAPPELDDIMMQIEEKLAQPKPKPELVEVNFGNVDTEKIEQLFEIFTEQISNLKASEISGEIDKFSEVLMNLQGLFNIIEWKNNLKSNNIEIDEQQIEKIKSDLNYWKSFVLTLLSVVKGPSLNIAIERVAETSIPIGSDEYPNLEDEEEYISPGLSQSQFEESSNEITTENSQLSLNKRLLEIYNEFESFTGVEISKKLQDIVDVILETKGYSIELKDIKDWISKLKKEKTSLEGTIKERFVMDFVKWKENYYVEF